MKHLLYYLRTSLFIVLLGFSLSTCKKAEDTPVIPKSSAKSLDSPTIEGITSATATYDATAKSYTLVVPIGTDLKALKLTFTLPVGASVKPASGSVQDFTNPVTYTVTAEDGSTQIYAVQIIPELPKISGKPSAASLNGLVTGQTGGDKIEFQVDLYVVDKSGQYVQGLKQTDFSITTTASASSTYALTKMEIATQTLKSGGYSAMLALDQSTSIIINDLKDLRIEASKIFLDYLGPNDQAALASFSEKYKNYVIVHQGFSRNKDPMKKTLDSLSKTEAGGTPLYYSTIATTDYTGLNAKTSNKAVIIFTDGQNDAFDKTTLEEAITNAKSKNISLFTVGLSSSVNTKVLSQMANETGGAFFYAKDAEQLVTSFGTLGNLLRGNTQLYRTTWTATRKSGKWASGNEISEIITVKMIDGSTLVVPFYVKVP